MSATIPGTALLAWGCQGTVDYRASLNEDEFRVLGFSPPREDVELFIMKEELARRLHQLSALGIEVTKAAGGSPMLSAFAAQRWLSNHPCAGLQTRFAGARPPELRSLLKPGDVSVLAASSVNASIGGTISLEFRPAGAKLMLSVVEGRWLDSDLSTRTRRSLWTSLEAMRPARLGLGLAGLNKSTPRLACELIALARRRVRDSVVFVSGGSFARQLIETRPRAYWNDLQSVFAAADIVSVNETEERQLDAVWGDAWVEDLTSRCPVKLVIVQERRNIRVAGRLAAGAEDAIDIARREADQTCGPCLTGQNARFDGVISAVLLSNWDRLIEATGNKEPVNALSR